MDEETPYEQLPPPDLVAFPGKDQLWWPSWQSLFEDGQTAAALNRPPVICSPDSVDGLEEHPWTPGADQSPTDSAAVFSPSVTSPSRSTMDASHDGRVSKRKAQNRAAYVKADSFSQA